MIIRSREIPKVYSFVCDGCPSEFLQTDQYVYAVAFTAFLHAGWAAIPAEEPGKKKEWRHYCEGCAKRLGID